MKCTPWQKMILQNYSKFLVSQCVDSCWPWPCLVGSSDSCVHIGIACFLYHCDGLLGSWINCWESLAASGIHQHFHGRQNSHNVRSWLSAVGDIVHEPCCWIQKKLAWMSKFGRSKQLKNILEKRRHPQRLIIAQIIRNLETLHDWYLKVHAFLYTL